MTPSQVNERLAMLAELMSLADAAGDRALREHVSAAMQATLRLITAGPERKDEEGE